MDGKPVEKEGFEKLEIKRFELEMDQLKQDMVIREIDCEIKKNTEQKINEQEIVRRNLEALCLVWKTFNIPGVNSCNININDSIQEKIVEHLKKLSA